MIFRSLLPAAALAAAALALPATGAASGSCARLVDIGTTGMDPADAVSIRISGIACGTAYRVIRRSVRSFKAPGSDFYKGFRCNQRFSGRTTCTKGARSVSFRLG